MANKKITKQNYDIIFRAMTEQFGQKALDFYGIDTAPIVGVEPTDLPVIDINDSRMDFVFLLEDDSYLHLEFQTTFEIRDLERFKLYDTVLHEKKKKKIYTYVVYGANIEKAKEFLDHGSIQYRANAIYMKGYDGDVIFDKLAKKIHNRETLTEEEQLQLIFLPLMHTRKERAEMATDVVELAYQLEDESQRFRLIGATVGIGDKYLDESYVEKMLEVLKMTRIVERIYKDGIEEGKEEGKEEGREEGKQEAILTYLETRFELKSVDIQNKIEGITDIDVLNMLIAKLFKADTEKQAEELIDEYGQ